MYNYNQQCVVSVPHDECSDEGMPMKLFKISLLTALMLLGSHTAVADDKCEAKDYMKYGQESDYARIVDSFYDLVAYGPDKHRVKDGERGLADAIEFMSKSEALNNFGYSITDLNGDCIPELIIAETFKDETKNCQAIYALYTIHNKSPRKLYESPIGELFCFIDNTRFFKYTSESPDTFSFGEFEFVDFGVPIIKASDFFFNEVDKDNGKIRYYHNTNGLKNANTSEELNINEDVFNGFYENFKVRTAYINDLKNFAQYGGELHVIHHSQNNKKDLAVKLESSSELGTNYSKYSVFTADHNGPKTSVLISSSTDYVTDFAVLSLELTDTDSEGNYIFEHKPVYTTKKLYKNKPLLIKMTMKGNTPVYGISFKDNSGKTRYYAFYRSSDDSDVELIEFNENTHTDQK